LLIRDYNALFIHIPKTGGTSIEFSFGMKYEMEYNLELFLGRSKVDSQVLMQHATIEQLISIGCLQTGEVSSLFKFAFVRNPWDRAVSNWQWLVQGADYQGTLLEYLNDTELILHEVPQWSFIYDKEGKPIVDFVGRFETLQEDFNLVCDFMNCERKVLPHEMKTKRKHYSEYYTTETLTKIAEMHHKDIELFGYNYHVLGGPLCTI